MRACAGLVCLWSLIAPAAQAAQPDSGALIAIHLEQRQGEAIHAVSPKTVFKNGDIVRFRLTSEMAGYLYVVDKGTTGETDTLFPATKTQEPDNRIVTGRSYHVPAQGDGWFEVSGPPGYDVLYFLVSATPLALPRQPSAAPAPAQPVPPTLLPRCDDAIFKARGDCLDSSAGAEPLPPAAKLPRELAPLASTASRDIILTQDGDDTDVRPAPSAKLPLIYTFRLAHR